MSNALLPTMIKNGRVYVASYSSEKTKKRSKPNWKISAWMIAHSKKTRQIPTTTTNVASQIEKFLPEW
jgi:hypothetical protein